MQMLRSRCSFCGWVFDVVAVPILLTSAAHVMEASHCPMCGNRGGNRIAEPRDLTAPEREFKLRVSPEGE